MKFLLKIFFVFAISGIVYSLLVHLFTIQTIEVTGDQVGISIQKNTFPDNLIFFPVAQYENRLRNRYEQIDRISIRKRFPDTLIFDVRLRKPVAILKAGAKIIPVDEHGYLLFHGVSLQDKPVIDVSDLEIAYGTKIADTGILRTLEFITYVSGDIRIGEYRIGRDGLIHAKTGKTDIILSQNSDMKTAAATLQTIFTGVRMKGAIPATIDLHFAKPILIY